MGRTGYIRVLQPAWSLHIICAWHLAHNVIPRVSLSTYSVSDFMQCHVFRFLSIDYERTLVWWCRCIYPPFFQPVSRCAAVIRCCTMWITYKFNANDVVEHIERNIHDCNILTTFSPNIFRMIYEFRVWPPTITINYYQLVTSLSRNYDAQLMLLIRPFWCFILNESHPIKYWCATVLLENEHSFLTSSVVSSKNVTQKTDEIWIELKMGEIGFYFHPFIFESVKIPPIPSWNNFFVSI